MVAAQVMLMVQAITGLLMGILCVAVGLYILIARRDLSSITSISGVNVSLSQSFLGEAAGVVIGAGVVVIALSVLWLWGGIATGRPSNAARWVMAVFTILITLLDIAALLSLAGRGGRPVGAVIFLGYELLILYGLLLDGDTRRAYEGR